MKKKPTKRNDIPLGKQPKSNKKKQKRHKKDNLDEKL